jgi:anti-sigma B factor antagonist
VVVLHGFSVELDPVRVAESPHGGAVVVTLHGDHDISTVDALKSAIDQALAQGAPAVIVDLAEATVICSVTLNALLWGRERARRLDSRLILCSPTEESTRLLRISGLAGVFDVTPTRSAAVELAAAPSR